MLLPEITDSKLRSILDIIEDCWVEELLEVVKIDNSIRVTKKYPIVTVTNEYGDSTVIRDLYVRFYISDRGLLEGCPKIHRSTYSWDEWQTGYRHSHCQAISLYNYTEWSKPCYGKGPINNTFTALYQEYSPVDYWRVLASDLDDYVQVESIKGIPYMRLSDIGRGDLRSINTNCNGMSPSTLFGEIAKEYIPLIAFDGKMYVLGMSMTDYFMELTKACNWLSKQEYVIVNDTLYIESTFRRREIPIPEDKYLFMFKDRPVNLQVDAKGKTSSRKVLLVNSTMAISYRNSILYEANLRLGYNLDNNVQL